MKLTSACTNQEVGEGELPGLVKVEEVRREEEVEMRTMKEHTLRFHGGCFHHIR